MITSANSNPDSMESLELNLYRKDFNVISSYSVLNRVLQSFFITLIFLGIMLVIPLPKESATFILIVILFGVSIGWFYISGKYLRKIYPDWPKSKNFIGTIHLTSDSITITEGNQVTEWSLNDCQELLIFSNHFTGYIIGPRDAERNGNGLLFYKRKSGEAFIYKFPILTEGQFTKFQILCTHYKEIVPYFREYLSYEIPHILKSDLTDRIRYN